MFDDSVVVVIDVVLDSLLVVNVVVGSLMVVVTDFVVVGKLFVVVVISMENKRYVFKFTFL